MLRVCWVKSLYFIFKLIVSQTTRKDSCGSGEEPHERIRAGAGVITNFVIAEETVYLLSIYDKSDKENLSDKELNELLKFVPE